MNENDTRRYLEQIAIPLVSQIQTVIETSRQESSSPEMDEEAFERTLTQLRAVIRSAREKYSTFQTTPATEPPA